MAEKEKRKNENRRPFQWWLLGVGFALGIALMVLVQSRNQPGNMIVYE